MAYRDPEKKRQHSKNYYQIHKGSRNPEKLREANKRCVKKLRGKVIAHYSNGNMICAHCNEEDIRVLCVDHIDGNGSAHRKAIGRMSGTGFYRWLVQNDFPEGYQVLCYNCNVKKCWEQQEYGVKNGSNKT